LCTFFRMKSQNSENQKNPVQRRSMETLMQTLHYQVDSWRKYALAGNRKKCQDIVIALRAMGYFWPQGVALGKLWEVFLQQNYQAMCTNCIMASNVLQQEENLLAIEENRIAEDWTFGQESWIKVGQAEWTNAVDLFNAVLL